MLVLLNHTLKPVRDYACLFLTDFQNKKSLPSEDLAKLDEIQYINSQLEEVSKIKIVRARDIERIRGIYEGDDEAGEKEFEKSKEDFVNKQTELFSSENSLLTKKF